jgi:hypothetical protein
LVPTRGAREGPTWDQLGGVAISGCRRSATEASGWLPAGWLASYVP